MGEEGLGTGVSVSPDPRPCPQELVREMVEADVELMRTNPNA